MDGDELMTPIEAAERARVSAKSIYRWASRGDLGRVRLGRLVRIRRSDLEAFLDRNHDPPRSRGT